MALSIRDMRNRAHKFVQTYTEAHKENAEAQSFLNDFFEIFDIPRRRVASFERPVKVDDSGTKRIDLFWPGVLLVEMKSQGQNLDNAYQQGLGYFKGLKNEELPRFVMVCDLNTFRLFDLDHQLDYRFQLADLPDNLDLFSFMLGKEMQDITEYELNERAALLLGELHDALQNSGFDGHPLQVFMVRVLFCMFAEDTGVFNPRQFIRYLLRFTHESGHDTELHLHKIFQILDTPYDKRHKNLPDEQAAFPYVNGHLFRERIDMPSFSAEMRQQLIECCYFNWKDISPAVFGSLFQSIMDKQARRNLGAHYTSEQNIQKVIEPLFLTDLKTELDDILALKQQSKRNEKLMEFSDKLRSLTFLDPACGCGNFLIITYRELRRLELKVLHAQHGGSLAGGQSHIGLEIQPGIPLNNFYGIEIDEWPARIAEVAMWLTQHQMNVEFAKTFGEEPDLLPLKEHANIHHANALEMDWAQVVEPQNLNYIIGNPPFVGHSWRSKQQQQDMEKVFPKGGKFGKLDFVASWFYKAAKFSANTQIEAGLVSTNSICMGEQTGVLWQPMLDMGIKINFAHRTFAWDNDAKGKAAVHCIIVGFAHFDRAEKWLFDYADIKGEPTLIQADNINPYLIDTSNIVLPSRSKPPKGMPAMTQGNKPVDGGYLILNEDEREALLAKQPGLVEFIKPFIGGREWINNLKRYCLWFADASAKQLAEIKKMPEIQQRLEGVKQARLKSPTASVREYAEQPFLFTQNRQPKSRFIAVPEVSSERRDYIPLGFLTAETIPSNKIYMIPDVGLYEFGVLISQMHMEWMRVVAGRLKSDYSYSPNVYQLFPWPQTNEQQKAQIEKLAQAILDARQAEFDKDPTTSLADLYDPDIMPPALRKAHKALDSAVDKLYQPKGFKTPLERVKHLFELYQQLTTKEA
jgi:hypothetical protein